MCTAFDNDTTIHLLNPSELQIHTSYLKLNTPAQFCLLVAYHVFKKLIGIQLIKIAYLWRVAPITLSICIRKFASFLVSSMCIRDSCVQPLAEFKISCRKFMDKWPNTLLRKC